MKIKGFIAVKGKTNTGKSHIIIRCFLKTLKQKAILIEHKFIYPDFVALVEWQGKYLGFISRGDDIKACKQDYQRLEDMAKEHHTSVLDSCVFAITEKQRINAAQRIEEFWKEKLKENGKEEYDEILELDNSPVDNIRKNREKIKSNVKSYIKDKSKELLKLI